MFSTKSFYVCFTLIVVILQSSISEATFRAPCCEVNNGGCGSYASCSHDLKTKQVVCKCKPGYVNTGNDGKVQCTAVCDCDNGGCGAYATCSYNTAKQVVECSCKRGYVNAGKDGKFNCIPRCQHDNGGCGPFATCSCDENSDVVSCTCKTGYTNTGMNGKVDCKDSCTVNNGGCGANAACFHEPQKNEVRCACKSGYVNAGKDGALSCKDACSINNGGCGIGATCSHDSKTNDVVCKCKSGFTNVGNGGVIVCKPVAKRTTKAPIGIPKPPHKPCRPVKFDPIFDHHVEPKGDGFVHGAISVKLCRPILFVRKAARNTAVCNHIQGLLKKHLVQNGVSDDHPVHFVKVEGQGEYTKFHYKVPCAKSRESLVSTGLVHSCQSKCLADKFTEVKKPDSSESSSECNDH